MQVLAPISQPSPMTTRPTCGTFTAAPSAVRPKPKPSAPMTAPGWMMTLSPMRAPSRITALA